MKWRQQGSASALAQYGLSTDEYRLNLSTAMLALGATSVQEAVVIALRRNLIHADTV